MEQNNGPKIRHIPAESYKVCHGCKYLEKQAMVRAHDHHKDNYYCQHPESLKNEKGFSNMFGVEGKLIHFNHSGDCTTPDWCPFLNSHKNDKVQIKKNNSEARKDY